LRYAFSPIGIIDFVGIFPTYLLLIYPEFGAFAFVRILRVLRVLRIFALGRIARATNVILKALIAARYKIAVFAALVAVVVLVAGALMYAIEGPEGGFTNIPLATYWAVATLTTVGHPDLFPVTTTGQILASVLMVLGYGFIAVSVGVITSEVVVLQQAHTELLGAEESERLEYKASAFYSYQNPDIPESHMFHTSILKPTAGFLNAKGGTLVIGMSDDGDVVGVQKDLELKQWNIDQYVNRITDRIASNLGEFAAAMTTISVVPEGDQHLCLLEIARSPDPVYRTGKQSPVFYARINNSTREISGPSLVSYVQKRWN